MIHKHDATRLHYDLRLEIDGVLASWAVPKGPSYDPAQKRLAVRTEDHPLAYADFEGRIPENHYGAGDSLIWERGTFDTEPPGEARSQLKSGRLLISLHGQKLNGKWHLIRTRPLRGKEQWLLFKAHDEQAREGYDVEVERPESLRSGIRETHGPARKGAVRKAASLEPISARAPARTSKSNADQLPARVDGFMLATLATPEEADAKQFLFEVKYDGFRALAALQNGRVALTSRGQQDFAQRFPSLPPALAKLRVKSAVLDGEVVAFDARGVSRFELLQQGHEPQLVLFDLLWLNGGDLRRQPLEIRRERLAQLLKGAKPPLRLAQTVTGSTTSAVSQAERGGWEGVIAKRRGSFYSSERSHDWLKLKVLANQEVAIAGFTAHSKGRPEIGALLLAIYTPQGFRFAGKVGTGFSEAVRKSLFRELSAKKLQGSPPEDAPRVAGATWVTPTRVAQIRFTEWTRDGKLRHPSFQGLRDDKKPEDCVREAPAPEENGAPKERAARKSAPEKKAPAPKKSTSVVLTHGDRVLFPKSGITKADVFAYYRDVAEVMVPALEGRPLAFQQWPQGISHPGIFRQGVTGEPDWAHTATIVHADKSVKHLIVDRAETLEWLANQSALTLHIPAVRIGESKKESGADWVLFDLDPFDDDRAPLIRVAQSLHQVLEKRGLDSVPKTSGQRGLHVLVPLAPGCHFTHVQQFAEEVMEELGRAHPDIATTERMKAKRGGRLYLDAMQNAPQKTMVAPYTLRAREGAPVSTPLKWSEVNAKLDPTQFNLKTLRRRLDRVGDLFAQVLHGTQRLDS
jgi:bifunctional non-homologous end joining protein LigD